MNIYDEIELEYAIEKYAAEHEGEIDEEQLKALVETQTQSLIQIEKLVKFIKHVEYFIESCKVEKDRINQRQKIAEHRLESIKRYLTPYVKNRGKFDAGTFALSTRKSEYIELTTNFDTKDLNYNTKEEVYKPDKKKIKEAIEQGIEVPGARIVPSDNLQIK